MESIKERMENPILGGRGGSREIGKNMDNILNKSFIDIEAYGEEEEEGGENREKEEEERDKKEVNTRKHVCKRRKRNL